MRRASLLLVAVAVALVPGSGAAIAAVTFGTDRTDFLVGTKEGDALRGRGGDDPLDGREGDGVLNGSPEQRRGSDGEEVLSWSDAPVA